MVRWVLSEWVGGGGEGGVGGVGGEGGEDEIWEIVFTVSC